jgi:hypothetical protein
VISRYGSTMKEIQDGNLQRILIAIVSIQADHSTVGNFTSIYFDEVTLIQLVRPLQGNKVVYEEWVLQYHRENRKPDYSHSFLGLKIKGFYEEPGFGSINAELKSQIEMKDQHLVAAADMSATKHKDAIKKAIQIIPKDGGLHINNLIKERTVSCSDESHTSVVGCGSEPSAEVCIQLHQEMGQRSVDYKLGRNDQG